MTSVLVLQHEDGCPVDRLGGWLADEGVELVPCRPYAGDPVPARVVEDGLVVLGGHMGANDDAEHAWLGPTKALLAASAADGTPVLGICLGGQLLAAACGGRVEVGTAGIEAGVADVAWRAEADGDRLFSGLPPYPGPSMHLDAVVELPPGAVWLGQTPAYPHQVFRVGEAAWGVQFHPEVSVATYTGWSEHHDGDWERWGIDGAAVVQDLVRRDGEVERAGRELARRFAGVLAERPASGER